MKKILVLACISTAFLYANNGEKIFNGICANCHGLKADMRYIGKVSAIINLSKEDRLEALKGYKEGKNDKFEMGGVMQKQLSKLTDNDIISVNNYIETLK